MNVAHHLERSASFFPHRPAVCQDGLTMSYQALNESANRVAGGLVKLGIRPGDLVALCAPNSAEWIVFYFGVLKAGAVAVTLSSVLTGEELSNLIRHSRPRLIYASPDKLDDLEPLKTEGLERIVCPGGDLDLRSLQEMGAPAFPTLERDPEDTAAVLYTGGTTGTPKGVMLSHEGIGLSSYHVAHFERSTEEDRALCFMPFNHVFGQIHIMNATILSAGCLELLPSFDIDRVMEALEAGRVSRFYAVPTVYIRLLARDDLERRLGKLRYCFSAAASLAGEVVRQWKERTGITIAESYGMTEGMPITYNHYYRHRVGSVGQAVFGVEVQIRDTAGRVLEKGREGEICVRGRVVMKGYLNHPEATRAAFWEKGWYRSGDVGLFDEDDYLYIVDRLKDLIISGGENVYPREVEEVLYTLPEVEECAVVGVPDREWGEKVTAYIKPKAGLTVQAATIRQILKARLAPFKVPKEYIVVSELPKSPTGKILKRELKKVPSLD